MPNTVGARAPRGPSLDADEHARTPGRLQRHSIPGFVLHVGLTALAFLAALASDNPAARRRNTHLETNEPPVVRRSHV